MENKLNQNLTVSELQGFPYKKFENFQAAYNNKKIQLSIDRQIAHSWSRGGMYCPQTVRFYVAFLAVLPWVTILGFIAYVFISGNWFLLFALPVFFIAFIFLHPAYAKIIGVFRLFIILLIFISLGYSFFADLSWLTAFAASLVIIWWSLISIYKSASNQIRKTILKQEDLLCDIWSRGGFSIDYPNGDMCYVDWKIENGNFVVYEEEQKKEKRIEKLFRVYKSQIKKGRTNRAGILRVWGELKNGAGIKLNNRYNFENLDNKTKVEILRKVYNIKNEYIEDIFKAISFIAIWEFPSPPHTKLTLEDMCSGKDYGSQMEYKVKKIGQTILRGL